MISNDFLFQVPRASYWLIFLLFFFIGEIYLHFYRKKQLESFAEPRLLGKLLLAPSLLLRNSKLFAWALVWGFLCLALMSPIGNIRYIEQAPSTSQEEAMIHEIIFLVDLSPSMNVSDTEGEETRLQTAKEIMTNTLPLLNGRLVSIYGFASKLQLLCPPTLDYIYARLIINSLHIDEKDSGGTRIEPVVQALNEETLSKDEVDSYSVVLLSDGEDTGEREKNPTFIFKNQHVRFFSIGLGSIEGKTVPNVLSNGQPVISRLRPEILEKLATQTNGNYFAVGQNPSWDIANDLMTEIDKKQSTQSQNINQIKVATLKEEHIQSDLYFQIPLGIALFFFLSNLILPERIK